MNFSKGKVVRPCVAVDNRNQKAVFCPYLDINSGCSKGFVKKINEAVSCPEGKGPIVITSETLSELIQNVETNIAPSEYAQEILNHKAGVSGYSQENDRLFV